MELEIVQKLDKQIQQKRKCLKALEACGVPEEYAKAYQELSKLEHELDMTKSALTEQIRGRMPDGDQSSVLIYRYVALEKFSAIASEMNICKSYTYKLHRAGKLAYETAEAVEKV